MTNFPKPLGVLITERTISMIFMGKPHNITDSHVNFEVIKEKLLQKDYEGLENLVDIPATVAQKISTIPDTDLTIKDDVVMYKGYPINNVLSNKLLEEIRNGYDISGFARFVDNLMQNPSSTAINELYLFIQKASLPLTDDGHFLAYKKVRGDYKDIHSGQFDNSIGQVLEMPRNLVDDNRDITCSNGFHFCSYNYLPHFGTSVGNKVMVVKINPKDVVSIPSDYDDTKGRACRYEVIAEIEGWEEQDHFKNAHGSQWDDDDYQDLYEEEELDYNEYEDPYGNIKNPLVKEYDEFGFTGSQISKRYDEQPEEVRFINPTIIGEPHTIHPIKVATDGNSFASTDGVFYSGAKGSLTKRGNSIMYKDSSGKFISKGKAQEIGLLQDIETFKNLNNIAF